MQPELIADYSCRTGESPMWHPMERCVYWADIPAGKLFRYDPSTRDHGICYEGDIVGGYTVQANGALLFLMAKGAARVWRDGRLETVLEEVEAERDTRFKDCVADPAGRVFVGTVSTKEKPGRLYRIDTDASAHLVLTGIRGSNGMGFTPDKTGFYYTDSSAGSIYLFDYDEESGALANQRTWVHIPHEKGVPDGMTVDAEGHVWSARWGGSCVVRYAPDGTEELRIGFPAEKVSSCIFGGPDYGDLYVTTAGGQNKPEEGHGAGALFRVRLDGIRGVPEYLSRVGM